MSDFRPLCSPGISPSEIKRRLLAVAAKLQSTRESDPGFGCPECEDRHYLLAGDRILYGRPCPHCPGGQAILGGDKVRATKNAMRRAKLSEQAPDEDLPF